MRSTLTAIGVAGFVAAIAFYMGTQVSGTEGTRAAVQPIPSADADRVAQLSRDIVDLQLNLGAVRAQIAEPSRSDEQPLSDGERRRLYLTQIADAFAAEKPDAAWSHLASERVATAFQSDDDLRGVAPTVDCRRQTCRVEIHDDGSGKLAMRLPLLALSLVDILPSMTVDHVDRGDSRSVVLYMSSVQ